MTNGIGERGAVMSDIAARAGVSLCTVSRVINNHPAVSKKTRKKVEKAIDELHYIPNENARALHRKKTLTVAFIIPDISNPYYSELFQGASEVFADNGFSIFLCNTNYQERAENNAVRDMIGRGVDGIVMTSFYHITDETIHLLDGKTNIVAVQTPVPGVNSVETDDDVGAASAVDYLIRLGHTRIAFVCMDSTKLIKRRRGYFEALEKNGIERRPEYLVDGYQPNEAGYLGTKRLLELPDPPTAILYVNDHEACGGYTAIREKGLRIPEDISVVGFDDVRIASLLDPALTTVHQPIREMGRTAAQMLLTEFKETEAGSQKRMTLSTRFMERSSAAAPRR